VVADRALADQTASLELGRRPPMAHHPTGAWRPITSDGIELFNPAAVPIIRYRYRGNKIPNPWHVA
jgi:hypothetical protein